MQDVTNLKIYNRSFVLLKNVNKLIVLLPKDEFYLKNQILRAARGIPANISEGFAKRTSQFEFRRFLRIALGSSDEIITHLRVVLISNFPNMHSESCNDLMNAYCVLSKQINSYIQTITKKINRKNPPSEF